MNKLLLSLALVGLIACGSDKGTITAGVHALQIAPVGAPMHALSFRGQRTIQGRQPG